MVILLSFTGEQSFMVSVLRKSLFFPGILRCGTWRLRGAPEHTGINILFLCRVPVGRPLFII